MTKTLASGAVLLRTRRIERVRPGEDHTLVVKHGGSSACLRFNEAVSVTDLASYCTGQLGWSVEGMAFVVDGQRYEASQADVIRVDASTNKVELGHPVVPSNLEFVRKVGAKG